MQVGLVPQHPRGLHGIVQIVLSQFLQSVECLLIHQEALFNPAFESTGGTHARETFLAVEHFDALTIFHIADAIKDGRDLIAQSCLRSRDVGHFEHTVPPATARRKQQQGRHHRRKQPDNSE